MIAMAMQDPGQCPLAVSLPVNIGRVEEIHAGFDRGLERRLDLTHRHRVTDRPDPSAADAEYRNAHAVAKRSSYHRAYLFSDAESKTSFGG